jgi:hypothetical protein
VARFVSQSLTGVEEFLIAGRAVRDVFPGCVVYKALERSRTLCQSSDRFETRTTLTCGVWIVFQNGTLNVRLYAIPALFRGFRPIHRGSLCHERGFHVHRFLFGPEQ